MSNDLAYSQIIQVGQEVITSGQISVDEKGELVGYQDIKLQTTQILKNIEKYLTEKDFSINNIYSVTVFLQDIERDFKDFSEAYKDFFKDCKPARITVQAKLFKPEFLIEVQVKANKMMDNTK